MMPIRFPSEAANDPDGKLKGLPESTGEDDIDALRGQARSAPEQDKDSARKDSQRDDSNKERDKP